MTSSPKLSVDFSPIAHAYDGSRGIPGDVLSQAVQKLTEHGVVRKEDRILDVGCGTGQITVPFVQAGHSVTGVDISFAMLEVARGKVPDLCVHAASAYHLPVRTGSLDVVVASKLFQHLRDWPAAVDEIARVLRPGGKFVIFHDKGAFRNDVRQQMERRSEARGYADRYLGVSDAVTLHQRVESTGARFVSIPCDGLSWVKTITYGQALEQLRKRLFAEFWEISSDDYTAILSEIEEWMSTLPDGAETRQEMAAHLQLGVYLYS